MTNETVTQIALDHLRESPFNPRLTFDEADLAELADSIKAQGVMQPIVVRPISGEDHLEIVFGHRRYRASKLAGLDAIPIIIRAFTDEEAAVAQVHENLKRADVHALEEALGYVRLMNDHKVSIKDLIEKTGKSKSYIYARLKLAQLGEDARNACLRGELDAETGVLIARYCPSIKQQRQAIGMVTVPVDIDFSADYGQARKLKPISYREAKRILRQHFCIRISEAPFDTKDPNLLPGASACPNCPKLAGNDPELADANDADACTDSACYEGKCERHVARQISQAKKRGLVVVEGDAAKQVIRHAWASKPDGTVRLNERAFTARDASGAATSISFAQALECMGKKAPKPTLYVNPHKPGDVIEALSHADALAVLVHGFEGGEVASRWEGFFSPDGRHGDDDDANGDDNSRAVDTRPPADRAVLDYTHWDKVRRAILERVATTRRTVDDLRMLALHELRMLALHELRMGGEFGHAVEEVLGWTADLKQAKEPEVYRLEKVKAMTADQLAALLVMCAVDDDGSSHDERAASRQALAKRFGVDVLEVSGLQEEETAAASAGQGDLATLL